MQNDYYSSERWGRLCSLRTSFPARPAGRKAGRGQDCPPHISTQNRQDFVRTTLDEIISEVESLSARRFEPKMPAATRGRSFGEWKAAVARTWLNPPG